MKTGSYIISAHPNEPAWQRLEELSNVTLYAADSDLNECWQLIETDEEGYGFLLYHFTVTPAEPGLYIDSGGAEQVVLKRKGTVYDAIDFRSKYSDIEEALQNASENDLVCEAPGGGWEIFPAGHPAGWYVNGDFVKIPASLELASVRMPRISHDDCEAQTFKTLAEEAGEPQFPSF
jgi:hypothetical protein